MFIKILGASTFVLLITCLAMFAVIQTLKVDKADLVLRLTTLQTSYDTQENTIDSLIDLASKNADSITDLNKSLDQSQRETENVNIDLTNLRYTEAEKALAKPFERGNAAYDRKHSLLLRFQGTSRNPD